MDQMPLRQGNMSVGPQDVSMRSGRVSFGMAMYACLHVYMVRI